MPPRQADAAASSSRSIWTLYLVAATWLVLAVISFGLLLSFFVPVAVSRLIVTVQALICSDSAIYHISSACTEHYPAWRPTTTTNTSYRSSSRLRAGSPSPTGSDGSTFVSRDGAHWSGAITPLVKRSARSYNEQTTYDSNDSISPFGSRSRSRLDRYDREYEA